MSCLRERGLRGLYGIVVRNFILLPLTPPPWGEALFSFFQILCICIHLFKVIPLSLLFSSLLLHKMPYLPPFSPPSPFHTN